MKIKLIIFLMAVFLFFSLFSFSSHDRDFSYTKAICEGNTCADYYVECSQGEIKEFTRISGFVTFGDDWEDFREDKELHC